MEFANKSGFVFDQLPEVFSVAAAGTDIYTTPDDVSVQLGDLARLKYQRCDLSGSLVLDAAGSPVVTVRLTDGTTDYASVELTFAAEARKTFSLLDVDLSAVSGATKLKLIVDVGTLAAGRTAQIAARLDVSHPLMVGGC